MIILNYNYCHIFQCICNVTIRVNGLLARKPVCIPQTFTIYLSLLHVRLMRRHHQNRDIIACTIQLNLCDNSELFALTSIARILCFTC